MLFDLRGKGRRRAVRFIYSGLAVLMGVGLIGFGIGGGFGGGGILSAATNNEGGSAKTYAAEIKKYRKLAQADPANSEAWEKLTKALLHEAGGENLVTTSGLTSKGKERFSEISQAWNGYLASKPKHESSELAQLMVSIYSPEGLDQPSSAVQALQIVIAARPTVASLYVQLAEYAYLAKNVRVGDLASAKAVELAPAESKKRTKSALEQAKKESEKASTSTSTSSTSTGTTVTTTPTTTTKK